MGFLPANRRGAGWWHVAALFVCAGCEASVVEGVAEEQANSVVVALDSRGIAASKEREEGASDTALYRVVVAKDDVPRALTTLRADGLPNRPDPGVREVFAQGGLIPTATEERARYASALGGDIASSIESIDGVIDARVHIALPEARDFALDSTPATSRASVLVRHASDKPAPPEGYVRALVAGAVPGMSPEAVAVVAVRAARSGTSDAQLVRIGPIAVTRGSALTLKLVLGAAFALHLVLAALLLMVLRQKSRPESAPTDDTKQILQ